MLPIIESPPSGSPTVLCLAGSMISPHIFDGIECGYGFRKAYVDYLSALGPWDIETIVDQLVQIIHFNQWSPLVLAAYSAGGVIAMATAIKIPDQIDGLILSNTGMNTANHGDHNFPQEVLEKWDDPAFTERFIRRCFSKPIEPYLYEELYEYARKLNAQSVYQVSSSLRKTDLSDEICNIRCPVSIVHGRDDQVRKISHAQDLADRLPDATLSLISGGHTVMVENREEWMKELDALLLRVINRKGVNAIGFK